MKPAEETGGARLDEERVSMRPALLEREAELAAIEALIGGPPAAAGCWRSRGRRGSARPR